VNKYMIGLVGIGKLGRTMMTHWDKKTIPIGVYHPMKTKAEHFVQPFQNGYVLEESGLP
jgi:3-hydroxyisobutyrate dehydrogenase-like beta-hydroxyacid dehydrogenase